MDFKVLIGRKVVHRVFGVGTIIDVDKEYVTVDFNGTIKKFKIETMDQYFYFDDEDTHALIQAAIDEIKAATAAAEAAKKAAMEEELERRRREAEERAHAEMNAHHQHNNNRTGHDEPSFERLNDDRMYFIVFQNNAFDIESSGNYLWAPLSYARWNHFWERMTQVRKGDVIFHCRSGEIQAVSVAEGSCYNQIAPSAPEYDDYRGRMGRKVDTAYTMVPNTIKISNYRTQIMATYPAGSHYAPFDRNGDGNQGYLFELDNTLANTFLNDIMKKNPGWHI